MKCVISHCGTNKKQDRARMSQTCMPMPLNLAAALLLQHKDRLFLHVDWKLLHQSTYHSELKTSKKPNKFVLIWTIGFACEANKDGGKWRALLPWSPPMDTKSAVLKIH